MAKGVQKIRCVKGKYYPKMSVQNEKVVIVPDQFVYFMVSEWYPDTTEEEKKRDLTWMRQDTGRKTIIRQMTLPISKMYGVKLPKKLCGPYSYYVEASLFGKRDPANTGLYVNGHCPARIVSSKWSTRNGGSDERKSKKFAYGETVYLNLSTEGLNGCTDLSIEIYNIQNLRGDKRIFTYNRIHVTDGEINLEIRNTSSWQPLVSNIQEEEKFYIKVKNGRGQYIIDDNNDDIHARFLRIKNELVSNEPERPKNLTPVRIGKPQLNMERYEPCKFETISITEVEEKNGKAQQKKIVVFDNGKNLSEIRSVPELVNRTVYFTFDSAAIESQSRSVLDNTLRFLLEHEHSTITLNGYACVIGKADYNKALSLERSQGIKQYLTEGGLNPNRIISNGKGEILSDNNRENDTKDGADNLRYKDEKEYIEARRVDISFTFYGHDAHTVIYETIAPSSDRNITIDVTGFETKSCFRNDKNKHEKKITVSSPEYNSKIEISGESVQIPIHSALSVLNIAPLQYIWPKWNLIDGIGGRGLDSAVLYNAYINSCRYFSNEKKVTVLIKAYPDIKWTLEFKWNHKQAFAYSYGRAMHPYDIKTGQKKVIGSVLDGAMAAEYGEMDQSFELSLEAEWNKGTQKIEIAKEFGEKIAKTLRLFLKIKKTADAITKSPVNGGKISFEIKAPVIAVSLQWSLERASQTSKEIGAAIELGVESKPLLEANGNINLWKIFTEYGANALCPGAGTIIRFVLDHLEGNVGMHFLVIFIGAINVKGRIRGNTLLPAEADGKVETTGKIGVSVEFKAWAKAEVGWAGFDGYIKANVDTSITAGVGTEFDKHGVAGYPLFEFAGIVAKYVAVGTVKFGIFKRTFSMSGEYVIVEENKASFNKFHIVGPYE